MAHGRYLTQPCSKMSIDYGLRFASAVHSEEFVVCVLLGPRLLLDDAIAAEAGRCRVREKGSVDDPDGSVIPYFQVQQSHIRTTSRTRATGRQDVVPLGRVGVHLPQHQPKEFTYCNVKENA